MAVTFAPTRTTKATPSSRSTLKTARESTWINSCLTSTRRHSRLKSTSTGSSQFLELKTAQLCPGGSGETLTARHKDRSHQFTRSATKIRVFGNSRKRRMPIRTTASTWRSTHTSCLCRSVAHPTQAPASSLLTNLTSRTMTKQQMSDSAEETLQVSPIASSFQNSSIWKLDRNGALNSKSELNPQIPDNTCIFGCLSHAIVLKFHFYSTSPLSCVMLSIRICNPNSKIYALYTF